MPSTGGLSFAVTCIPDEPLLLYVSWQNPLIGPALDVLVKLDSPDLSFED